MHSKSIFHRALTLILGTVLMALIAVTVVSVSKTQQKVEANACGISCPSSGDPGDDQYCASKDGPPNAGRCPYCANFGGITWACYSQDIE